MILLNILFGLPLVTAEEEMPVSGVGEVVEESTVQLLVSPSQLRASGYGGRQVHSFAEDMEEALHSGVLPAAIPGVSGYYTFLPMDVETQINEYYCGPATVIQNLEYISDGAFSMTQQQVAVYLNTETYEGSSSEDMTPFMNNQINNNGYSVYNYAAIDIDDPSFDEIFFVDTVYSNCEYYDWPAYGSFRLRTSVNYNGTEFKWPYSTSGGHFLSISGVYITSTDNCIEVTDSNYLNEFPDASENDAHYLVHAQICMTTMLSFIW